MIRISKIKIGKVLSSKKLKKSKLTLRTAGTFPSCLSMPISMILVLSRTSLIPWLLLVNQSSHLESRQSIITSSLWQPTLRLPIEGATATSQNMSPTLNLRGNQLLGLPITCRQIRLWKHLTFTSKKIKKKPRAAAQALSTMSSKKLIPKLKAKRGWEINLFTLLAQFKGQEPRTKPWWTSSQNLTCLPID